MMVRPSSLLDDIPDDLPAELCQTLFEKPNIRIERIVSRGHTTPIGDWYDQTQDEWVLLLKGQAELAFEEGETVKMNAGDALLLPRHCKHRVAWTPDDEDTIWLAIHCD